MYLMHVPYCTEMWAAVNVVQGCADYFESEADTKSTKLTNHTEQPFSGS
jgi:hypothetical protein